MKKILTVSAWTLLFLLVVLPVGSLIRLLADPLRLRRRRASATYFRHS